MIKKEIEEKLNKLSGDIRKLLYDFKKETGLDAKFEVEENKDMPVPSQ